jgi:2-keto-3-deoxy-L-rhamnonate aldolase RhmA
VQVTDRFREKMRSGQVCIGSCVSFSDPTVSEALGGAGLDFLWIDMEHGPLGIETVQAHVMAAQLVGAAPLVRVAWNDPVLIKAVLDVGAAGVIVPMVRTAGEAERAVAACRYPPAGIRGFGPRRPSNYGRLDGPALCKQANESVVVIVQIEHVDAVRNLDEILAVPGVDTILIGANDLAGSLGKPAQAAHPDVMRIIDTVIDLARQKGVFVGIPVEDDPAAALRWIGKGVLWLAVGSDVLFLSRIDRAVAAIRRGLPAGA